MVRDDGSDQGLLVPKVVVDLRGADTGRLLDIAEARAGNAVLVHQLRCHRDDPIPGGPPLGGEPALLHSQFVRCHQ